jgi:hypothetical protein
MKRIYAAAALMVASGAAIGFVTRAQPAAAGSDREAARSAHARDADAYLPHNSGGPGMSVPALSVAAPDRVDCFYLRVAYNSALKAGGDGGRAASARAQAEDAGCWVAGPK